MPMVRKRAFVMSSASSALESIPWTKRRISAFGPIVGSASGQSVHRLLCGTGPRGTRTGVAAGEAAGVTGDEDTAGAAGETAVITVGFLFTGCLGSAEPGVIVGPPGKTDVGEPMKMLKAFSAPSGVPLMFATYHFETIGSYLISTSLRLNIAPRPGGVVGKTLS